MLKKSSYLLTYLLTKDSKTTQVCVFVCGRRREALRARLYKILPLRGWSYLYRPAMRLSDRIRRAVVGWPYEMRQKRR